MRASLLSFLLAVALLPGQTLDVYSEFLRVGPTGEVLPADRTAEPREIISPAIVRGGYASFQVVVRAARGNFFLFLGANPPDSVQAVLYRQEFVKGKTEWVPDRLGPTKEPIFSVIPDPEIAIPDQAARTYLLDVWAPPATPPGRMRLEVQMKAGSWTIYPMEMRVLPVLVPAHGKSRVELPELDRPSADAVLAPLEAYLGGKGMPSGRVSRAAPLTLRHAIRRNAEQDLALAPARLIPAIREKMKANQSRGGEWFLAIRDLIYREAGGRE